MGKIWTTALREHRSSRREPWPDRDVDHASRSWDDDDSVVARGLIAGLPERQRLVLFLRYYADLDYRSIGNVLDIEMGTVGASLSAARATLRNRIEEVVSS
jgi:RNA polymerase sigma factor (sigma-70 family)